MDPNPPATDPSRDAPQASRMTAASAARTAPAGRSSDSGPVAQVRARAPPRQKARRSQAAAGQQMMAEPAPMLDVEEAMKEIVKVPAATIHRTAAFAWASRAIAGYRVCASKAAVQEGLSYLYLGEHYREAALAHAAMGEAWQPLFAEIDEAMSEDRARAFASMRGRSPVATR